jgi:uncharacterized protein (DUF427 family)
MARPVLVPTAEHPITIEPTRGTVTVRAGDRQIAQTRAALTLREASYPPVQYIPLADVDPAVLRESGTVTYCPYKGQASYYSVQADGGQPLEDLIWTYQHPYPAVAQIEGHVAFYPDRTVIEIED